MLIEELVEQYQVLVNDVIEEIGNPFERSLWTRKPISKNLVKKSLDKNQLDTRFSPDDFDTGAPKNEVSTRLYHARRIAYLIKNYDPTPIVIECTNNIKMLDGWHRLSAAIYNNQKYINVTYDGYEDCFNSLFPNSKKIKEIQ